MAEGCAAASAAHMVHPSGDCRCATPTLASPGTHLPLAKSATGTGRVASLRSAAEGAEQCAEHCTRHAHADPKSQDAARPKACDAAHPQRCAECAQLSALVQDVTVLLGAAEAVLKGQLQPAAARAHT